MRATNEILAPILLALVLAICTAPILYWLMNKGAPSWLALLLTIGFDIVLILVVVWLVGNSVQNLTESLPQYEQRFDEIGQSIGGFLNSLGYDPDMMADGTSSPLGGTLDAIAGLVTGIVSGIANWGTIVIMGIFFLVEATILPRKVESVTHGEPDQDVQDFLGLANGLRQYMVINAGVGAMAAVLNTILLAVVGVEAAVLWGVLSFFLSFIPSIGFLLSVIPPAILALVQFGWQTALIVVVLYIGINFLVDNVIKPKFIQEGVNISAMVTFVSLFIWAWVLGPIGAILAVPMAIIIQAVLDSREETRWLAYLMGSGEEPYSPKDEPDQDVAKPGEGEPAAAPIS
jgi:predicted PurR-regulated permease PerM